MDHDPDGRDDGDQRDDVADDIAAADVANGEPAAMADHPTGEAQAARNREDDPPA